MSEKLIYIGSDNNLVAELSQNFNVEAFANPYLASKTISKSGYIYAILCEDNLKGINAFDFHKEINNIIFFRGIPFIILFNNKVTKEIIAKGINQEIDDIIEKPIKIEAIERRLKYLKKYKSKKTAYDSSEVENEKFKVPFMKRMFDIVFASVILLMLSPLFLIITFLLKLESKGPVFYASKRVGMGYKIFDFYKFRSMYQDADKRLKELAHLNQYSDGAKEEEVEIEGQAEAKIPNSGTMLISDDSTILESEFILNQRDKNEKAFVKIKNDPRITKVGRFIRKTSIDELPQLVNVLKGDMSIVGNRPIPLYEAEVLTSDAYSERFLAPAGITGLWQVSKRGKSDMSNEERKQLDNIYAQTYTFWGDIKLLFRTVGALMQTEDV